MAPDQFIEITYILLLLVNIQLLFLVLFSTDRTKTYMAFSGYLISVIAWVAAEYFAHVFTELKPDQVLGLWWSRATPVGPLFAPAFAVWFTYLFGRQDVARFTRFKQVLLFAPAVVFALLSPTSLNIESVSVTGESFDPGILFDFYFAYVGICFFLWLPVLFVKKMRSAETSEEKRQIAIMLSGLILTGSFVAIFAIVLPAFFHRPELVNLAPYATLFYTLATLYALLKHRLFNVKIVTTQLFSGTILIFLFLNLYNNSLTTRDVFVNGSIFVATFVFTVLLIRSVLDQVKQKEQIETLAKGLSKANGELADLNEHLEEKVKEQTIEIRKAYEVEKKAKEELLALDKAKTDFILTTQHHLRTPLTVARAAVTSLGARQEGETYSNTDVSFIQKGIHAVDTLAKLMNEFLEISQMEVGKSILQKHPIPIRQLVENVLGELHDAIEEKRLTVSLTLSPEAEEARPELDAARFKDVALNLVDNCVRYTPKGGSLSIEGDIAVHPIEKTRSLILTFTDSGIGMTEDELARAFAQSFERGTRAKEMNATGRGLGLMLARQIVEAHGGRIRAESGGRDRGTRFMVEVPIGAHDRVVSLAG